jgi:hypothetical protein
MCTGNIVSVSPRGEFQLAAVRALSRQLGGALQVCGHGSLRMYFL